MTKLWNKLVNYIEEEDVRGLVRFCLILLPFAGGAILGMGFLVRYITLHKEALIILGVAACMIIPAFMGKEKQPSPTPKTVAITDNLVFFNRMLMQSLFTIFNDYARQFQIIPPEGYKDLKDTLPSSMDMGKGIIFYRFKVIASGEPITPADFHEFLTTHIEELLVSGDLAVGKPVVEFNGTLYPRVCVDRCVYESGTWHLTLLICDNEQVARYLNTKQQTLVARASLISRQYEDEDF